MRRKWTTLVVLVGALFLGCVLFLVVRDSIREPHRFVLSDGSVVTFQKATFGTNHTAVAGGSWERFVPGLVARRFGLARVELSLSTTSPEVMLWFEKQKSTAPGSANYTLSLVHPDGLETLFGVDGYSYSGVWSPTNTLEGFRGRYPQWEKMLRFRFYESTSSDDQALLGEFTIQNPSVSPWPLPSDTAPLLPQVASDSDLTVTLTSLGPITIGVRTNFATRWTRTSFLVTEAGEPNTNWFIARVTAIDPMGNSLRGEIGNQGKLDDFEIISRNPELWPGERYRLQYEFSRKTEALTETNEVWTIPNIAVPTNGSYTLGSTQWHSGPFTVRFHGLNSASGQPPWQTFGLDRALNFSVSPAREGHRFTLLSVKDERGESVGGTGWELGSTNWGFQLRLKGSEQRLQVKVALHRSRFVEFHAQPSALKTVP